MRFRFPLLPGEFEIPDDWWTEAGMSGFVAPGRAYRSTGTAVPVSLREIEPPFRLPECMIDWNGFNRPRLISILKGFVAATEIAPVPLIRLASTDFPPAPFDYRVRNGFHRFYASVAAGFECLSAVIDDES